MTAELLAQPRLSIITRSSDAELALIQRTIEHTILVDERTELEDALGRLLAADAPITPKTLDLIGHTTSGKSLLLLGEWEIDATSATVTSFFRGLADQDVLGRLGIHAVRLLGCMTADTDHGRWTICQLADILGVEVYGTTGLLFASHYDRRGFTDASNYVLTSATELRATVIDPRPQGRGAREPRVLDLDSLPARPLEPRPWPVRVADRDEARALLRLVRRRDGSILPGLLAAPCCEIAFPAAAGGYHHAQVLLDGEIVRVYPDGEAKPGIVYPVDDPSELKRLVAALPAT